MPMTDAPPRWKRAFPDFAGLPAAMPAGFRDASWPNDAMPSFVNPDLCLRIWVDYPEHDRREAPDAPRFSLVRVDGEGEPLDDAPFETEDWSLLLEAIEGHVHPAPRP